MLWFKGEYCLFASKSVGCRRSPDMRRWTLIEPQGLPVEDYAPAVAARGATGYLVRYGIAPDKLCQSHQAWDAAAASINALGAGVGYFVAVDAFNESGATPGTRLAEVP
jgi:hypothetical protein